MGILFYEFLHGKPPFDCKGVESMKKLLFTKPIELYAHLSTEVKELIKFILRYDKNKRPTATEILS